MLSAYRVAPAAVRVTSDARIPSCSTRVVGGMPGDWGVQIGKVALAVLLPPSIEGSLAAFTQQSDGYTFGFADGEATLLLDGTRVFYEVDGFVGAPTDVAVRGVEGRIVGSEGTLHLAWLERGAAYLLSVSCAQSRDFRCSDPSYLVSVANELVYAGGSCGATARVVTLTPDLEASTGAFAYNPAGQLEAGPGSGQPLYQDLVPRIRFPLESAPAYANSQVYRPGGQYGSGVQCAAQNYSYPWWDNFCESRPGRKNPVCPSKEGHQGQDIRPSTCADAAHYAVAAAKGQIGQVAQYSVTLKDPQAQVTFWYLHMSNVGVSAGQEVELGDRMGKVSKVYSGDTTIHLHFEAWLAVSGFGHTAVGPYRALVESYQRLLQGKPCKDLAGTCR